MMIFVEIEVGGDYIYGFLGQWWRFLKPVWIESNIYISNESFV